MLTLVIWKKVHSHPQIHKVKWALVKTSPLEHVESQSQNKKINVFFEI